MLKFVIDDICNAPEQMILQGCNAQGVMNSGVAKAIRNKWPEVYEEYKYRQTSGLFLGSVILVEIKDPLKIIACIITQEFYGYDGRKYARYSALVEGLREVRLGCKSYGIRAIATPPIGCGLGGLKKEFVFELLEECLTEHGINVTVYDNRENETNKAG